MKFEPLVYFSAINKSQKEVSDFADYDSEIDNPFMGTYHFLDLQKEHGSRIETIWYDFYKKSYYNSIITLDGVRDIIDENSYIDICYLLGGTLLIWAISPIKSNLIQPSNIATNEIELALSSNDEWLKQKEKIQQQFDLQEERIEKQIELMNTYTQRLVRQYIYKYLLIYENWDEDMEEWKKYNDEEELPEFDYIEENLFDGTHDKLHDDGLLNYHQAGKPKKLAIKWHIKKSEYTAYFWFEDEEICALFDRFYGAHPETKSDFMIRIDAEKNKYELALYRYGLKEPQVISESAYQLIVFKNKFEYYRSENYDQPRGAWIW